MSTFDSKLQVFQKMDQMSSELQKVRESEEQLRVDRRIMMEKLRDARKLIAQDSKTDARLLDIVTDMQVLVAESSDGSGACDSTSTSTASTYRLLSSPRGFAKQRHTLPDRLPSQEESLDARKRGNDLEVIVEDTDADLRSTSMDTCSKQPNMNAHLQAQVHPCPKCSKAMTWSDFAGGAYADGWACDNIRVCGSRWSTMGSSRWFCQVCQVDVCDKCQNRRSASDRATTQIAAEAPAPVKCYDHHGSHCDKCSTKFTLMKRRHHCRGCGACVCHTCSPYTIYLANPIVGPGESKRAGAHRVCRHCYTSGSSVSKSDSCGA